MFNIKKSSGLGGLFGGGGAGGGSSDSDSDDASEALRYHRRAAPSGDLMKKNEAKMQQLKADGGGDTSSPSNKRDGATSNASAATPAASSLSWNCSLYVYKYSAAKQAFEALGDGICGLAILGAQTTFNIIIYDKNKTTLVMTPLNGSFEFSLQPGGYASFYDNMSESWSLRFLKEEDGVAFARNVSLTRYHVAIHGSDPLPDSADTGTLYADALLGDESNGILADRDAAKVMMQVWPMSPNANDKAHLIVQSQPCIDTGNETRTVKLGDSSSPPPVGGIQVGIVGMCKGGKRHMLIPPSLAAQGTMQIPHGRWLYAEVSIYKIRKGKTDEELAAEAQAAEQQRQKEVQRQQELQRQQEEQSQSNDHDEAERRRQATLRQRMANLAGAGGNGMVGGNLAMAGMVAAGRARGQSLEEAQMSAQMNQQKIQVSMNHNQAQATQAPKAPQALETNKQQHQHQQYQQHQQPHQHQQRQQHPESNEFAMVLVGNEEPSNPDFRDSPSRQSQQQGQMPQQYTSGPQAHSRNHVSSNNASFEGNNSGMLQLVQMSTSSTERIVRGIEVKVDRMLQLQNMSGGVIGSGSPGRRIYKDPDELSGEELLEKLGHVLAEGKGANEQVEKLQDKLQSVQEKYADALEKKQKYMDEAMELREKHSDTMESLSSLKQEKFTLAEEISSLKAELSAATAASSSAAASAEQVRALQGQLENETKRADEFVEKHKITAAKVEEMTQTAQASASALAQAIAKSEEAEAALAAARAEASTAADVGTEAARARAESSAVHKSEMDNMLKDINAAKEEAEQAANEAKRWEAEAKANAEKCAALEAQLASSGSNANIDEELHRAKKDMAKTIYSKVQETFVDEEDFSGKKVRKTFKGWLKKLV